MAKKILGIQVLSCEKFAILCHIFLGNSATSSELVYAKNWKPSNPKLMIEPNGPMEPNSPTVLYAMQMGLKKLLKPMVSLGTMSPESHKGICV